MKIMTTRALEQWRKSGVDFTLVDVLPEASFEEKHIPGSVSAPLAEDFVERVRQAVHDDRERNIVVYCANTSCDASPRAARELERAGFVNVFDYEAGLQDWEAAGHELEGAGVANGAEGGP